MKKVLLIDVATDGHHLPYLSAILKCKEYNYSIAIPKCTNEFRNVFYTDNYNLKKFRDYRKWLSEIYKITEIVNPDIIHIVFGDFLYRFCGYGIKKIRNKCDKLIVTFHQLKPQKIAFFCEKFLFRKISTVVVTTEFNYENLKRKKYSNVLIHEIPHLIESPIIDKNLARQKYNLSANIKIFGCFGILSEYKRIDLVIDAFNKVDDKQFCLLIAGKPDFYTHDFIINRLDKIKDNTKLFLNYLSDEDFFNLINSCDYIITPYSLNFNGNSGPLTEAVWLRKNIISSNLRSLGKIVNENNLGYTFECDDLEDLVKVLNLAIKSDVIWSKKAETYRYRTSVDYFASKLPKIYDFDIH